MCGIGGWYATEDMTDNQIREAQRQWAVMMRTLEVRGVDAAGMFTVADDGHVRYAKRHGPAHRWVWSLESVKGTRPIVIGHTRHATQGDPSDNANNHPFIIDPIVGVHNGIYAGYAAVAHRLPLDGGCDSEAIFAQLAAERKEQGYLNVLLSMNSFNRVVFWDTRRRRLYAYSGDRHGLIMARDEHLPVTWITSSPEFLPETAGRSSELKPETLYTIVEHPKVVVA